MKNPAMLAAVLALAALGDEGEDRKSKMSAEDYAALKARQRQRTEAAAAQRQAEYDAVAAPYREARRARKAAQLAREQRQ